MAMAEESEKGAATASKDAASWGTLEELLLACAVARHGTNSWDLIAREVQKPRRILLLTTNRDNNHHNQSSHSNHQDDDDDDNSLFSPLNCERKYRDLRCRFNNVVQGAVDGPPPAAAAAAAGEREVKKMVDVLRKLRVEELRREVRRHDDSIESLQLEVKRLKEERENSPKIKAEKKKKNDDEAPPRDGGEGEADLRKTLDQDGGARSKPDGSCAEIAVKSVSGERSDEREDGSFNESNSMGHRDRVGNNAAKGPNEQNRSSKPDPVRSKVYEPEKDSSSSGGGGIGVGGRALEGSGCGKAEVTTIVEKETSSRPTNRLDSDEGREETVREEGSKQQHSSDVQSSASLSKRRRRRRGWRDGGAGGGGEVNSSGDEMEAEELSPANKRLGVKSQPLIKFMEIIRSHKHGLVFQRRLPSQETEKYRNLTRQHMDLETVLSKLDRGMYCDCHPKFYRDLLLIFTNAILFFRKSSAEHMAARELRKFVSKEIARRLPSKSHRLLKPGVTSSASASASALGVGGGLVKTDLESQILDQVVKKPRSSSTIVVCRRRTGPSSLKPLTTSDKKDSPSPTTATTTTNKSSGGGGGQKKESRSDEKTESTAKEKKKLSAAPPTSSSTSDQRPSRKGGGEDTIKRERSSLGSGGRSSGMVSTSKDNHKKFVNSNNNHKTNKANKKEEKIMTSSDEDDDEDDQPLSMKAKQLAASKKQGAVNFLKRMKQNSPSLTVKDSHKEEEEEEEEDDVNDLVDDDEEIGARKKDINKKKDGKVKEKRAGAAAAAAALRTSGRKSVGSEEKERDRTAPKRGVGRPPTRKTSMGSGGAPDSSGRLLKKRKEGAIEKDAGDSGRQPKKKPRK